MSQGVSACTITLLATACNVYIYRKEIIKRRSGVAKFPSFCLEYWSLICMILGVVHGMFMIFLFLFDSCHFAHYLVFFVVAMQPISMGFYQISRIHYCFAESKAMGYPNIIFYGMYSLGVCLILNHIVQLLFCRICQIACSGYDPFGFAVWSAITRSVYFLWEMVTMSLYAFKLRSIVHVHGQNEDQRTQKVVESLRRILTVTIIYQIACIIGYCMYFVGLLDVFVSVFSALCTFSMFFMLEHNNDEYTKCMRCVSSSRCFCGFHGFYRRDIEEPMISETRTIEIEERSDYDDEETIDAVFEEKENENDDASISLASSELARVHQANRMLFQQQRYRVFQQSQMPSFIVYER